MRSWDHSGEDPLRPLQIEHSIFPSILGQIIIANQSVADKGVTRAVSSGSRLRSFLPP